MAKEAARDRITNVVKGLISDLLSVVENATAEAFAAGEDAAKARLLQAIGGQGGSVANPKAEKDSRGLKVKPGMIWISDHTRYGRFVAGHWRPAKLGKRTKFTDKLNGETPVKLTHFGHKRVHRVNLDDTVAKLETHVNSSGHNSFRLKNLRIVLKPASLGTTFRAVRNLTARGVLTRVGPGLYVPKAQS